MDYIAIKCYDMPQNLAGKITILRLKT